MVGDCRARRPPLLNRRAILAEDGWTAPLGTLSPSAETLLQPSPVLRYHTRKHLPQDRNLRKHREREREREMKDKKYHIITSLQDSPFHSLLCIIQSYPPPNPSQRQENWSKAPSPQPRQQTNKQKKKEKGSTKPLLFPSH